MPSFGEKIIYPWSHTDEKVKFIYLLVTYKCKVQKVKQKVNYKQAHIQVFSGWRLGRTASHGKLPREGDKTDKYVFQICMAT